MERTTTLYSTPLSYAGGPSLKSMYDVIGAIQNLYSSIEVPEVRIFAVDGNFRKNLLHPKTEDWEGNLRRIRNDIRLKVESVGEEAVELFPCNQRSIDYILSCYIAYQEKAIKNDTTFRVIPELLWLDTANKGGSYILFEDNDIEGIIDYKIVRRSLAQTISRNERRTQGAAILAMTCLVAINILNLVNDYYSIQKNESQTQDLAFPAIITALFLGAAALLTNRLYIPHLYSELETRVRTKVETPKAIEKTNAISYMLEKRFMV
jgi:hypothetical protein